MPRKSRQSFVDAFSAVGIGHENPIQEPPYNHHCPKLPQEGYNMHSESCRLRRLYARADYGLNHICKDYPDCGPHTVATFAAPKFDPGIPDSVDPDAPGYDPETDPDILHAVAHLYRGGMRTRRMAEHLGLQPPALRRIRLTIQADPETYGELPPIRVRNGGRGGKWS